MIFSMYGEILSIFAYVQLFLSLLKSKYGVIYDLLKVQRGVTFEPFKDVKHGS